MLKNAIVLFTVSLVLLIIFLPSYRRMQDLRHRNLNYSRKIENMQREYIRLSEERRRLNEDPEYLERIAREKMGLVREGEVVYKFEGNQEN